jgi:hypothetical protein
MPFNSAERKSQGRLDLRASLEVRLGFQVWRAWGLCDSASNSDDAQETSERNLAASQRRKLVLEAVRV